MGWPNDLILVSPFYKKEQMEKIARSKVKELLQMKAGETVLAKGWVRTKRGNKEVAFIALNDGSTIKNIQIVVDPAL